MADADGVGAGRVVSRYASVVHDIERSPQRRGASVRRRGDRSGQERVARRRHPRHTGGEAARHTEGRNEGANAAASALGALPNASYYNVQLFRGKTKVFSAWPTRTRLQLSRTWMYNKGRQKLTPGTYAWYVWPGFGARTLVIYGELIGKSKFVILPPINDD